MSNDNAALNLSFAQSHPFSLVDMLPLIDASEKANIDITPLFDLQGVSTSYHSIVAAVQELDALPDDTDSGVCEQKCNEILFLVIRALRDRRRLTNSRLTCVRLPHEILGIIFEQALIYEHDHPSTRGTHASCWRRGAGEAVMDRPPSRLDVPLAQVCTKWRDAALIHRALWTNILFTCHSVPYFDALLNRTQGAPLDICVSNCWALPEKALIALLQPHLARVRSMAHTHVEILLQLEGSTASRLTRLRCPSLPFVTRPRYTLDNLTRLEVDDIFSPLPPLATLQSLRIRVTVAIKFLCMAFSSSPYLKDLDVYFTHMGDEDIPFELPPTLTRVSIGLPGRRGTRAHSFLRALVFATKPQLADITWVVFPRNSPHSRDVHYPEDDIETDVTLISLFLTSIENPSHLRVDYPDGLPFQDMRPVQLERRGAPAARQSRTVYLPYPFSCLRLVFDSVSFQPLSLQYIWVSRAAWPMLARFFEGRCLDQLTTIVAEGLVGYTSDSHQRTPAYPVCAPNLVRFVLQDCSVLRLAQERFNDAEAEARSHDVAAQKRSRKAPFEWLCDYYLPPLFQSRELPSERLKELITWEGAVSFDGNEYLFFEKVDEWSRERIDLVFLSS